MAGVINLERVCPYCGNTFYLYSIQWGYVIENKEFCTYSCMRAYEKNMPEVKYIKGDSWNPKSLNRYTQEQKEHFVKTLGENLKLPKGQKKDSLEMSKILGISRSTAQKYTRIAKELEVAKQKGIKLSY